MEDIYPEIALKQPKTDPRTVIYHKRNFLESSSDHIQKEFLRNSSTAPAKCDKLNNKCQHLLLNIQTSSASALKTSLTSASLSSSTSSSSLLSTILVNFSKSCHFKASFNNLYKLQKTKLFLHLFILCAIFLQLTQAIPVRRTTTSGRKLILHTNVYRERYHQKLLEEQRQHNQQQLQIQQLQQQLQHLKEQQLQQQLIQLPPHHPQQQVQRNHIYSSPSKIVRRISPQNFRHHLNQRAAPSVRTASISLQSQTKTMSYCNGNEVFENLDRQMNVSLSFIKQLCTKYLRDRGNDTFEEMSKTWNLISLQTRNPYRRPVIIDNELHKEIHDFYLNLHNFEQLIDFVAQDTNDNRTKIEHGEDISIDKIINFFQCVKKEIQNNVREADKLLNDLNIEKPNLDENVIEFDKTLTRKVRDFLIIKNLIEEFERIMVLVQNYCANNNNHQ